MFEIIGAAAGGVTALIASHFIARYGPATPALLRGMCVLCVGIGTVCPLLLPPAPALAAMALGWTLCVLGAIDIIALRLPDLLTIPLCVTGIAWCEVIRGSLASSLIGCGVGYATFRGLDAAYRRWRGRSGLGHGDAKLFAAAGAWLGAESLPTVTLVACAGAFFWVGLRYVQSGAAVAVRPIAFGPPLCLAFWLSFVLRMTGAG